MSTESLGIVEERRESVDVALAGQHGAREKFS